MKEQTTGHYVGAILGNLIGIAIINTVLLWRQHTQGVILSSWIDILWAANLSLVVQMLGNLLLAFYRPPRFAALMRALFAAASLVSLIVFFLVFPLDFSRLVGAWLNTLLKVLIVVGMAVTLITGTVQLVRFIVGPGHKDERTAG
jgi:hypothetical protein